MKINPKFIVTKQHPHTGHTYFDIGMSFFREFDPHTGHTYFDIEMSFFFFNPLKP